MAAVNEDGTKCGVSFYPPLHRKLMVTNNDPTIALKMKTAVFENNQYKLDAETFLVETVKLKKPFSFEFEAVKTIDDVIFELPLNTMTSIRGEITNIEGRSKEKNKFNYSFLHN